MAPKQPVAGPSRPRREPLDAQSPPLPAKVSAFNHSRTSFALALPVLGAADTVSVWDVATDRVIAEWEVEGASKVTTICWASTPSTASASTSTSTRKRKKRRKSNGTDLEDVVLITTAKGDLIVFSPERGEVLRKDELPTPVTAAWSDDRAVLFAAASAILVFDPDLSTSPRSFALPANMPTPTAIAVLRTSSSESLELVVGSMSVFTLRVDMKTNAASVMTKPVPVSTSSVASLVPLPSTTEGASFLVVSDDDRTVSQYTVPVAQAAIKLSYRYASTTLSPVHSVAISPNLLSVLHTSGEISLFPIPTELDFSRPRTDSNPSAVKLVEGKDERIAKICRLDFANSEQGITQALICGRMAGAGRVKWHRVVYESPDGGMRRATTVKCDAQDLTSAAVAGNASLLPPNASR